MGVVCPGSALNSEGEAAAGFGGVELVLGWQAVMRVVASSIHDKTKRGIGQEFLDLS